MLHLKSVKFVTGETRTDYYNTLDYASCKKTVWGHIAKTAVINNAGEAAVFGPAWAPDQGVLSMLLPPYERQIVVRVMDHAWGVRDAVLGEILLDISRYVGRGIQEVVLAHNGATTSSVLTFQLDWETSPNFLVLTSGYQAVKLTIIRATGLRQAGFVTKNNVYVEAYSASPAVGASDGILVVPTQGAALPVPLATVTLPAGSYSMPFMFQLPPDLPSSFAGNDCRITYSVYANIDIAWKMDPSVRMFFSVVQPHAVATMMNAHVKTSVIDIYPQMCVPLCCCFSFPLVCLGSYGKLNVRVQTDRYAYAPGDRIECAVALDSTWQEARSKLAYVTFALKMIVIKQAGSTKDVAVTCVAPFIKPAINLEGPDQSIKGQIFVPLLPPTYLGGIARNKKGVILDPVIWRYELQVHVGMNVPGKWTSLTVYFVIFTF
jgi:hypothetical protein